MDIHVYKTNPEKLESVLERIISRGESLGSWYVVERMGVHGLESTANSDACGASRVRIEIVDDEAAP